MNETKKLKIVLLSDATSWINPTVKTLVSRWKEFGHEIKWAHDIVEIPNADLCFCLSFGKIVKKVIRDRFHHTLVVHASDLPSGKGWSPLTWQIIEGNNRIVVTLFEADDSVDSGPIYAQRIIDYKGYELIGDLRKMLANVTFDLCNWFVSEYPDSAINAKKQHGIESFYPRRGPQDSRLDVNKSIAEQFNLLRVVDNQAYPAFFEYKGRRYVLTITDEGNA